MSAVKLLLGSNATEPVSSNGVEWDANRKWSGDYEETAKELQIRSAKVMTEGG